MALTTSEVRVAVSGEISVGPLATTAPTDATTALAAGFLGLGYVSEDGITETQDLSVDDIVAWQNAKVVRSVVTNAKVTYQFTLIQTNKNIIEQGLGTTVTQSVPMGTYTVDPASTGGRKSWVFNIIDGTQIKRIYIAEGEVTERGDTVYASGEAIGLELTVTAYTNPVVFDTALKS
jgi:hypothetical protein